MQEEAEIEKVTSFWMTVIDLDSKVLYGRFCFIRTLFSLCFHASKEIVFEMKGLSDRILL